MKCEETEFIMRFFYTFYEKMNNIYLLRKESLDVKYKKIIEIEANRSQL